MEEYVDSDYVKSDYIEGDIIIDLTTAISKKINFVIDNQGLDVANINTLLLDKVGVNYEDSVSIIFGSSLKVAEKINGTFTIKDVIGGISQEELSAINQSILEVKNSIPTLDSIKTFLMNDNTFMNDIKSSVLDSLNVKLVAVNGDEIASSLVFDEANNKYVLDYDTALLDGVDYTIELSLD